MQPTEIKERLVLALNFEPKTFAEISFFRDQYQTHKNWQKLIYLEMFLAFQYIQKKALRQALKHLDRALEVSNKKLGIPIENQMSLTPEEQEIYFLAGELRTTARASIKVESGTDSDSVSLSKVSKLEERLLNCLKNGPKNKIELIGHLYDSRIDLFVAENRLKNLLHRLRIKFPDLIQMRFNKYELVKR